MPLQRKTLVPLPKTIRFGKTVYRIHDCRRKDPYIRHDGARSYGVCYKEEQDIFIFKGEEVSQKDAMWQNMETFIHECLHAGIHATGMNSFLADKEEEKFVEYFAKMMRNLLRENPDLIRFIAETGKKGS